MSKRIDKTYTGPVGIPTGLSRVKNFPPASPVVSHDLAHETLAWQQRHRKEEVLVS